MKTHLAGNGALVGGLALDGESDTVGSLGLDLEVGWSWLAREVGISPRWKQTGAGVVEVLVKELSGESN